MACQFEQTTFFGASVTSFSASVGWNEQVSQINIRLVEDTLNDDKFEAIETGKPATFIFEDFKFRGILQNWEKKRSTQGDPIYEVVLIDPREILSAVEIITSAYSGSTSNIKNLLNIYGYFEAVFFGFSNYNEGGMPWHKVKTGIEALINNQNLMEFKNVTYHIDLSELPIPPVDYRIGAATSFNLLELISMIVKDGGMDYYVVLEDDNTIKIKTVSRANEPSLTKIEEFLALHPNDTISSSRGLELRNDVTTTFLVGGNIIDLFLQTDFFNIIPYWGLDNSGNPILGQGSDLNHTVTLDASIVSHILGGSSYQVGLGELLIALVDEKSWRQYIRINRHDIANQLGLEIWSSSDLTAEPLRVFFAPPAEAVKEAALNDSDHQVKINKFYQFVKDSASEFVGKRFLVRIPKVKSFIDAETRVITYSLEPADAGFVSESATPLGLGVDQSEPFRTQDRRFQAFVKFAGALPFVELEGASSDSVIVQGNDIYVKCSVGANPVKVGTTSAIVITLDFPLFEKKQNALTLASPSDVMELYLSNTSKLEPQKIWEGASEAALTRMHPLPVQPGSAAIPLKSNIGVYGPWIAQGQKSGKVEFQQDTGLVPWDYGGISYLNLAANAKLANRATNMQNTETGNVQLAGAPIIQLGDVLIEGGPNVTGIDVSIGTDGVTTNYSMQTYTQRFGLFSMGNAERLKRLGQLYQIQKKEARLFSRKLQSQMATVVSRQTANVQAKFDAMLSSLPGIYKGTSHGVVTSTAFKSEGGTVQVKAGLHKESETGPFSNAKNATTMLDTAQMGMEGILRPVSLDTGRTNGNIAVRETPDGGEIDADNINPFKSGNDMYIISWGDDPASAFGFRPNLDSSFDADKVRIVALRGPLFVTGWGYGIDGKPDPNTSETFSSRDTSFLNGYLTKSEQWKAGPVDLRWDMIRKVWTMPGFLLFGTWVSTGPKIKVTVDGTDYEFDAEDYFGGEFLTDDMKVAAGYDVFTNKWKVVAADCE